MTANLTLSELNNAADIAHKRIYDRILERCIPVRINNRNIRQYNATANLKQAKHRQEEAEARNRKKERDARTHRLVQEGAILESIVPHIKEMDLDSLKRELMIRLRGM